jgi:hypothetical protein
LAIPGQGGIEAKERHAGPRSRKAMARGECGGEVQSICSAPQATTESCEGWKPAIAYRGFRLCAPAVVAA